jgi:hypothetical protein
LPLIGSDRPGCSEGLTLTEPIEASAPIRPGEALPRYPGVGLPTDLDGVVVAPGRPGEVNGLAVRLSGLISAPREAVPPPGRLTSDFETISALFKDSCCRFTIARGGVEACCGNFGRKTARDVPS